MEHGAVVENLVIALDIGTKTIVKNDQALLLQRLEQCGPLLDRFDLLSGILQMHRIQRDAAKFPVLAAAQFKAADRVAANRPDAAQQLLFFLCHCG